MIGFLPGCEISSRFFFFPPELTQEYFYLLVGNVHVQIMVGREDGEFYAIRLFKVLSAEITHYAMNIFQGRLFLFYLSHFWQALILTPA